MIRSNVSLLSFIIIFSACGQRNIPEKNDHNDSVTTIVKKNDSGIAQTKNEDRNTPDQAHEFSCLKSSISINDTITILLPDHYPAGLGIADPHNTFFFLFDPSDTVHADPYLSKVNGQFQLKVPATVTGVVYDDGKKLLRKVFTSAGKYRVILADNLETELQETYNLTCDIQFKK